MWNGDHKYFITLDLNEPPCTFSIKTMIATALKGKRYKIEYAKTINTCTNIDRPTEHGDGEYQIEIIIKKI
jgi:hypothetical protein